MESAEEETKVFYKSCLKEVEQDIKTLREEADDLSAPQIVAPPSRGWCPGTARGGPGSGGHNLHRHTGLVSPRGTGIAPTLRVGPCGACNPAWRRAAAAGGPARGGCYVGRRALPRGRATGHHVR